MSLIKLAGNPIKDTAAKVRDYLKNDLKRLPNKISTTIEKNPAKVTAGAILGSAAYLKHKKDK